MVKGIIENTHIISLKVTEFIWFLGYNNFSKMDMYFETEGVTFSKTPLLIVVSGVIKLDKIK